MLLLVSFRDVWLFLAVALCAGLVGTLAMTAFFQLVTRTGLANARMMTALGCLFTRSVQTAQPLGAMIHFTSGLAFGLAYTLVMVGFGPINPFQIILFGGILGFIQGLLVSLSMVWIFAEQHPVEEFRRATLPVALFHWLGHILYGLIVGVVVSLSGIAT